MWYTLIFSSLLFHFLKNVNNNPYVLHKSVVNWRMRLILCFFLSPGFLCLGSRSSHCESAALHTGDIFKPPLGAGWRLCANCGRKRSLQEAAESLVSARGAQPSLLSYSGVSTILSEHRLPGKALRTLGKGRPACWVKKGFGVIIMPTVIWHSLFSAAGLESSNPNTGPASL